MSESYHDRVVGAGKSGETPAESKRLRSRERAAVCKEAWDAHPGKNRRGVLRSGSVTITAIEFGEDENGSWVDVWTGTKRGAPDYRVVNPPVLASDSRGGFESKAGERVVGRYREDPVAALISVIGGRG